MADFISIDMANKMLHLVGPIVSCICEQWSIISSSLDNLEQIFSPDADGTVHLDTVATTLKRATKSLNKGLDELEELGCSLESIKEGVVDFPSIIEGERVMLCWKLGEEEILHYHKRGENIQHRLLIKQVLE